MVTEEAVVCTTIDLKDRISQDLNDVVRAAPRTNRLEERRQKDD